MNSNTPQIEHDEFTGDAYLDQNAQPPSLIVLNDKTEYGYFIPGSTMVKCGWRELSESDELHEHTFSSGITEKGVLIKEPRMLVCTKTDLYQYDVKASEERQTKVILGRYNSELKADTNVKTERVYLIFFLDEENVPYHSAPLRYAARGVNGATFEIERRAFKAELEACHAVANGQAAKPKNERFHCLGVFACTIKAEYAGDRQKSWACRVVGHEKPTNANWKTYFVGYSDLREYVWTAFEPEKKLPLVRESSLDEELVGTAGIDAYSDLTDADVEVARQSLFTTAASSNETGMEKPREPVRGAGSMEEIPF